MENHFILFPVMILVCIGYVIYYGVIFVWILIKILIAMTQKLYKKFFNKEKEGIDNDNR